MDPKQVAIAQIISNLGLSQDRSEWTYDERLAFNNALAKYIAANPELFSAQDNANALISLNRNNAALSDNSFTSNFADFFSNLEDEAISAGESVAGIGQGVLNFASLSRWLIPLAGIAVVVILLWGFKKKQGA